MSTPKRKLAAIVFADIAGYTDKANQDEGSALAVRERVERLIKASTIGHNGRVIKTMGDGAMLEFASAVEAVSCALDIQDQMDHLNEELNLSDPIAVRVGVHVGEVVEEDNDLYGNAVNIASRVHAMAKPGGICITREVYVQIRPILKLQCTPVPGASSDRMPEKVEVYTVVGDEALPAAKKGRSNSYWAAVAIAGVAVLATIGVALNSLRQKAESESNEAWTQVPQAHRLLLPDWVTPGEWFTLDSGENTAELAVYFGNKKAESKFENGKLMVQTPTDIPTEQTTIAVFEGAGSDPLMRQQTQVIRYGALAMHTSSTRPDTIGQSGPDVKIGASQIESPKPSAMGKMAKPPANNSSSVPPASNPPDKPKQGEHLALSSSPPLAKSPQYDAFVNSIGSDAPKGLKFEFKELKNLPTSFGHAMKAINLAKAGNKEEAAKAIRGVRQSLKGTDSEMAIETESLLKTAEAFIADRPAPGMVRVMQNPKFTEAFAFSVNRGTRNLPGLLFVERQIRDKNPQEARRALELLKNGPELTESEKKAVARLEERVKKLEQGTAESKVSASAPNPQNESE